VAMKKYRLAEAVTLHATTVQPNNDAFYVGVSGNVMAKLINDDTAVLFKNMVQGTVYPFQVALLQTSSEGTTATDLVVLDAGGTYD
jgi:hypothetical protein